MTDGFALLAGAQAYLLEAVKGVPADGWSSATPCSEWTVGQVYNHARLDQSALTMQITGVVPIGDPFVPEPAVGADPVAELESVLKRATAAWESVRESEVAPTPMGPMPPSAATAVAALDAALHAWDIARSTGQDLPLDDELAAGISEAAGHVVTFVRDSFGKFGPEVPATGDAGAAARLLAFSGRDPQWRPKA
ncbi:TIGR03086 family metal-binding protein [Actinacidiphila paucisporea]|uniref:TIGR03086 family protein n=1 Tax=Actinacidiphila paucisporea TaxID=310782 RepID=A0A1M7QDX4_9ACTN|nr:TIGR03086 family metal-binding protein [Actinacidiphila paucisporea]SHN29082.1 TIGR03086 family protein [Actinacidiphila paucisporea]